MSNITYLGSLQKFEGAAGAFKEAQGSWHPLISSPVYNHISLILKMKESLMCIFHWIHKHIRSGNFQSNISSKVALLSRYWHASDHVHTLNANRLIHTRLEIKLFFLGAQLHLQKLLKVAGY